jgi:hypothetical protein
LACLAGAACYGINNIASSVPPQDETLEMAAKTEAETMTDFSEIATECVNWYEKASKNFGKAQLTLEPGLKFTAKYKNLLLRYARDEYGELKNSIFDVLDGVRDAQRATESVQKRFDHSLKFLTRAVKNPIWKYSLIYSTKFTDPCYSESTKLQPLSEKVIKGTKTMSRKVHATSAFKTSAMEDLSKWDCDAMYPKPKKLEKPDIIGWAKQGYEVYNTVKDLLPEDSAAGPGDVPGTPEEEMEMFKLIGGETDE